MDANAHFDTVFSNVGWINRNMINAVRFSIIKIRLSIIFIHLRGKLTSERGPKEGNLDGKTDKTVWKCPLCHFFLKKKKPLHLLKNKKY